MSLNDLDTAINSRYGRDAMGVLYRGIQNFEDDPRLVEAARVELEEFSDRLNRLLRKNTRAAA